MQTLKSISIPEPCHQSWQQMTPVTGGRHCESCCKTVTDFTKMTNSDIIAHLSNSTNVCGRFEKYQLNSINAELILGDKRPSGWLKGWAMAIAIFGSVPAIKASAQTVTPIVQAPADTQKVKLTSITIGKIATPTCNRSRRISGHVIAMSDHTPVPGATITLSSNNTTATTDTNGYFSVVVPSSIDKFTVNEIGFEPMDVVVAPNMNSYEVAITEYTQTLGGAVVSISRPPFFKRVYYRFIKRPIYKIFHS